MRPSAAILMLTSARCARRMESRQAPAGLRCGDNAAPFASAGACIVQTVRGSRGEHQVGTYESFVRRVRLAVRRNTRVEKATVFSGCPDPTLRRREECLVIPCVAHEASGGGRPCGAGRAGRPRFGSGCGGARGVRSRRSRFEGAPGGGRPIAP